MKIAITLIHNKSNIENEAQITTLKSLLTEVVDGPFIDPSTGEIWTTIHHELIGLDIPHEIKVYQVIPYGITPPVNRGDVQSGNVVYFGAGDEDKVGNHPRFFNWGIKRGTDNGAEINIYLEDISKFNIQSLKVKLQSKPDFSEEPFGKIVSANLLKTKGQLREDRGFSEAIEDLKRRING